MAAVSGAVISSDGTRIGFERSGAGPALVIVHGGVNSAADWKRVAALLSPRFDCLVMDRRGRGASGDGPVHSLRHEAEDIAAVLAAAGDGAVLFGHSYGAVCALEAALIAPVARLIVYEPPLLASTDPGYAAAFQAQLDAGETEAALADFLLNLTGMPAAALEPLRASAAWQRMLAVAWTLPREADALSRLGPMARYAAIAVPVLAITGGDTRGHQLAATEALAAVIPGLQRLTLPGHGHAAHRSGPESIAEAIADFASPA